MSGVPLTVTDMLANLGPNYDYSALVRIRDNKQVFGTLPTETQDAINRMLKAGDDMRMIGNMAGRDRIGEGSYPGPIVPQAPKEKPDYAGQFLSVVYNLPVYGSLQQLTDATIQSHQTGRPWMDVFKELNGRKNQAAQEFFHQFTVGAVPSPQVPPAEQAAFNTVVKPLTALEAMAIQGMGIHRALSFLGGAPSVVAATEMIPQRLKDIGMGMANLGILDGLRADGLPSDPGVLDVSGNIAKKLSEVGVPDRLALMAGGATVGGIFSGVVGGIMRGVEYSRYRYMVNQITPEQLGDMREALTKLGIVVDPGISKSNTVAAYLKAMTKVANTSDMAGLVSEQLSRQQWITQLLYSDAELAQAGEEGRYLTGLLRGQPGSVSVATAISDPSQVAIAQSKLNLVVDVAAIQRPMPAFDPIGGWDPAVASPTVINTVDAMKQAVDIVGPEKFKTYAATVMKAHNIPAGSPSEATIVENLARRIISEHPKPVYDVLMSRPNYVYPTYESATRETKSATKAVQKLVASDKRDLFAKQTNELFILPNGEVVRGGFSTEELTKNLKVQTPMVDGVARPDIGVKRATQMVNLAIKDDNSLVIDLPSGLTQEQFEALAPAVNTTKFDRVVIQSGTRSSTLEFPVGQQVQDQVALKFVKPISADNRLTEDLLSQYRKTGVFKGQAAVLEDGTPVSVIRKVKAKGGPVIEVRDPLTQQNLRVHPDKVSVLPTSIEGEYAPSNLFYDLLKPEEQLALAKYRLAMIKGLDQPIKTYKELEKFVNSRGFFLAKKGEGFEITSAVDNDAVLAQDKSAVIEFIRKNQAPAPDLTPPEIKTILGSNPNFGFHLNTSAPPRVGEVMPIPREMVLRTLENSRNGRGAGFVEQFITPSRGLFLNMDKKLGTNFFPLFNNIQERAVQRQNFEAAWYHGQGPGRPAEIKPLKQIIQLAGKDANVEGINKWLESPAAGKAAIAQDLTPNELSAAKELRKWYDGLFREFGVEGDYLENYAPRIRELAPKYGNNPKEIYKNLGLADPLKPSTRGLEFWSDNYRTGSLDIYDEDAFRVAARYLTQGANNRFMKQAVGQAAEMVSKLAQVNENLARPMGYFLQAVKGTEFAETRIALSESMQRLLDALPGRVPEKQVSDLADKLTTYWMGAVYTGTMAGRPGLAIRNIANSMMMSWPLFGVSKGRYLEALGMTLSKGGIDAAITDGAISLKTSPIYHADEFVAQLPKGFDELAQAGFKMYESADEFTRAHVYWSARLQAEDAITTFAKKAPTASEAGLEELKKTLIRDSGLHMQDKQIVDEFLRRMAVSPEAASRFAGKQASDVVNFLYGRGMQARWMRGISGRLFGQFGTWPMWYLDYLRRVTTNIAANSGRGNAALFLAKHALINGAMAYAGHEALDVDLGKWMVYPSVFYSGGPGFQLAMGASTLFRGLGAVSGLQDDPYGMQRVNSGIQMIQQTLPSMIPFWFAGKDAIKIATADDPTDRVAALLGTSVDRQYETNRKFERLLDNAIEAFSTGSPVLSRQLNSAAQGTPLAIDPSTIFGGPGQTAGAPTQAGQPAPQVPSSGGLLPPSPLVPLPGASAPTTGMRVQTQLKRTESTTSAESRPPENY